MTDHSQSGKGIQFSIETLNDVLSQTKSIKKKLTPFLPYFTKDYNMQWIYETFDYLYECMTTPKFNLTYKFNAVFALKVLLDTSDFFLVNWIQVYFLPLLLDIAKYPLAQKSKGQEYFTNLGYTAADSPQIQKFGFNYTLLATQLIIVGGKMKPYKLFESEQMSSPSDFVLARDQLKRAGYKQAQKLSMYPKPQVLEAQIRKFEDGRTKLTEQVIDAYTQFSNLMLEEYLSQQHNPNQQKYHISIITLYESGDLFLSSSAVQICKAHILEAKDFTTFVNSLNVLHRLMLVADYESFFILNYDDTLINVLNQVIQCDKTERGIKRGNDFLPQFKSQDKSKKAYTLFLDYLQKWAIFGTQYANDKQNYLKQIVDGLAKKLKIELPKMMNEQNQRKTFQKQHKLNIERNTQLVQQIEKKLSALIPIIQKIDQVAQQLNQPPKVSQKQIKQEKPQPMMSSKSKQEPQFITPNPSVPSKKETSEPQFLRKLNFVQKVYDKFLHDGQNYDKNKAILQQFCTTFEEQLLHLPEQFFGETSQRSYNLQKQIEDIIKLAESNRLIQKHEEQKKAQNSFKKIQTQEIKSVTKIEPVLKQSKKVSKQHIEDTPVKRFDLELNDKNELPEKIEHMGYQKQNTEVSAKNNATQSYKEIQSSNNNVSGGRENLGYQKGAQQSVSTQKIKQSSSYKLGFEHPSEKVQEVPSRHELGYDKSLQKVNVPKANNLGLGYEQVHEDVNKLKPQTPSKKSIRKTEELSNSRKLEESSIKSNKSNSRVEKFSPGSIDSDFEKSNFKKKDTYEIKDEQIEPLEQDFEENFSVNKPKQFRSLGGKHQVQLRAQESQIKEQGNTFVADQRSNHKVNHEDYQSSSKVLEQLSPEREDNQEQIKLNLSRPNNPMMPITNLSPQAIQYNSKPEPRPFISQEQQYEQLLEQDEIDPPHINPLEQSFHDINELEQRIQRTLKSNNPNQLSFKNCFQTDKYILQREQEKKTKLYWMENDTTNLVKNIIMKKEKSRISKINVPEILDERNKKYQAELKTVEEEKNRKIQQLENKIKNMQQQTSSMKDQLYLQREEIKTLKANSEFDKESVGPRGYLQDVQNIAAQKMASPVKFGYSGVKSFNLNESNLKDTFLLDPKGKLVNSKGYKQYFKQYTKEKEKKLLLKSKDLIHKDKHIEIGFMSKKQNQSLIITFYITPQQDIQRLNWAIEQNQNITVATQPSSEIYYVRAKKQEKIFLTIQVKNVPYVLPLIHFTYRIQEREENVSLVVPCPFHKFVFIKENNDLDECFKNSDNILRGEEVPYSKRVLKNMDSFKEYFQCMAVLNQGQPNPQGQIGYGGIAHYRDIRFPIRISIKPNHFLYVQGVIDSRAKTQYMTDVVSYYISSVTHLLMKQID